MNMDEIIRQGRVESEFIVKVHDEIAKRGTVYNYTCPRCGGTIIACKDIGNGHLHMKCDNCDFFMME